MNTEWERVNHLFHQALECTGEARAELIARVGQNDPALQREVQSLLAMHEKNNSFMEIPALRTSLSPQFGRWQQQIVSAVRTPARKFSPGQDQMTGQLLDEKYEIEELCGRGGMGTVYRATHVGTGRRVAVKVIAPELAGNSEFIERFRQEAKTIGLLRHPNIVNVTDFGIAGTGGETVAYLVMEYLEGGTLAEHLKNRRPMPLNEVIAILSQTCAAMDEAHHLGILHRDLKPENIWLEPAGSKGSNIKVLDFGIARLQDLHAFDALEPQPEPFPKESPDQPFSITEEETLRLNYTAQQLSRFGSVMGTPKYMSPEQCRGERIDPASDVYSLGVIAYQMLTGEPPFTGTISEVLIRHCEAEPVPLREKRWMIPPHVEAIVNQALAKDKNARPQTAGAFAFLLRVYSEGNDWIRREADALFHKRRWKFIEIAVRMQWRGWLLSLLLLFPTLKFPGMSSVISVASFSLLWLMIAAIILRGHMATTAVCTLMLEQTEGEKSAEAGLRDIVRTVRQRSRDLSKAVFMEIANPFRNLPPLKVVEIRQWVSKIFDQMLIIPALIQEELSVKSASRRSLQLMAPIRQKARYSLFRRALAFALSLTTFQTVLIAAAYALDHRSRLFNLRDMDRVLATWLLVMPIASLTAFGIGLKSAIEQAVLYLTARRALGEIPAEPASLPLGQKPSTRAARWSNWKTYAPTCAIALLIIGFHGIKFPQMKNRVENGDLYTVKALHASGVPVPQWSHGSKPTIEKILRFPAMTKYLIAKGANVNASVTFDRLYGPLHSEREIVLKLRPGNEEIVTTPLMAALTIGSVNMTRLLIKHGANVHAQDFLGRTPMTIALTHCPQAIELLLASGVDINEQTRFGTPLLTAARYQSLYPSPNSQWMPSVAVRNLIIKGADPNARDSEGRNALMVMSMESQRDNTVQMLASALLYAGCDLNATDNKGRTPLIYAVKYQRRSVVDWLLKNGADISAKDHDGQSAFDWAKKSGNDEIVKILSSFSSSNSRKITKDSL